MKDLAKKIYYKFQKRDLLSPYNLKLGYIFHTEKIYNTEIFENLKSFCTEYLKLTGAKPICAIIPPTNFLLQAEMKNFGFSQESFVARIVELSQISTIGYHGHFYLNDVPNYYNGIHCNSFKYADLKKQFLNDLKWFEENKLSHNKIYAAGWWFFNEPLLNFLMQNSFKYDFSFSQARHFYNQYSFHLMNENNIVPGESFFLKEPREEGKILCIQNFIGMHATRFPQDFIRNMKQLLGKEKLGYLNIGVVNAHDYELDFKNTLNCVKYLIDVNNVKFLSFENLVSEILTHSKNIKTIASTI